jgi:hypothetical protein
MSRPYPHVPESARFGHRVLDRDGLPEQGVQLVEQAGRRLLPS